MVAAIVVVAAVVMAGEGEDEVADVSTTAVDTFIEMPSTCRCNHRVVIL